MTGASEYIQAPLNVNIPTMVGTRKLTLSDNIIIINTIMVFEDSRFIYKTRVIAIATINSSRTRRSAGTYARKNK